ncbi:hypothetical protein MFLAVUS_008902 [Mucor flavus]|uniref:Maturase K n=1 Tax=Mucor flavus TaxID=439312 RepID=A0ABP9Z8I9_9FUNG
MFTLIMTFRCPLYSPFVNITKLNINNFQFGYDWGRHKQDICHFLVQKCTPFTKPISHFLLAIEGDSTKMDVLSEILFDIYPGIKNVCFQFEKNDTERTEIKIETEKCLTSPNLIFVFSRSYYTELQARLPYITHLVTCKRRIKLLKINISESFDLNFILNYCYNLEKLYISYVDDYYDGYSYRHSVYGSYGFRASILEVRLPEYHVA